MANTKIYSCTCKHKQQDAMYGQGNRMHNENTKSYNCTVCGKDRSVSAKKEEEK